MQKWKREILYIAARVGVENASLQYGGKHPFVAGTVQGKPFRRAVSGSPSDGKRALTKARCDLKRAVAELTYQPS